MQRSNMLFAAAVGVSVVLMSWGGMHVLFPLDEGHKASLIDLSVPQLADSGRRHTAARQKIVLGANKIDLGEVEEGIAIELPFTVENTTTQPLEVVGFRSSCGCTEVATSMPLALLPGKCADFAVLVDTHGKFGDFAEEVVGFCLGGEELVQVGVRGHAVARLTVSPPICVFSPEDADSGVSAEVRCELLCGPRALEGLKPCVRAPWDGVLEVDCPSSLAARQTATMHVRFLAIPTVPQVRIPIVLANGSEPLGRFDVQLGPEMRVFADPPQLLLSAKTREAQTTVSVVGELPGQLQLSPCSSLLEATHSRLSPNESSVSIRLSEPLTPQQAASGVLLKHEGVFDRLLPVMLMQDGVTPNS